MKDNNIIFIRQLSISEKYIYYKRIKRVLIDNNVFSYEALKNAMDNKIKDIYDLI